MTVCLRLMFLLKYNIILSIGYGLSFMSGYFEEITKSFRSSFMIACNDKIGKSFLYNILPCLFDLSPLSVVFIYLPLQADEIQIRDMITSLFYSHVKEVNSIFRSHTFKDGFGQSYRQYGFRIDRVLVILTLCNQGLEESGFFVHGNSCFSVCCEMQSQSLKLWPFCVVRGLNMNSTC